KWNMALLSMRADKFWKKISIQGTDVAGFDKSKVECFNYHKMGHFDWSYMANDEENHALVAEKEALLEFALMANTNAERLAQVESRLVEHKEREIKYREKIRGLEVEVEFKTNSLECLAKKLETLKKEKKGLDDKNKERLGYSVVPPPPAEIYSSPKKDMSWTGLLEFKDDTVTDYSRHVPTVESSPDDAKNRNPSVTKTEASPSTISPKSFIKFVKVNDSPTTSKTYKAEAAKKLPVKFAEQYRKPTKKPNKKGEKGTSRSQNNTHKSFTPRPVVYKPYKPPMRTMRSNMNGAQTNRTSFNKQAHSYTNKPFQRTSIVKSQYRAPWVPTVNRKFSPVNRKFSTVSRNFSTVNRKFPTSNKKFPTGGIKFSTADMGKKGKT
nr:hypothetical protein [Tanacetum cinerariifolium]